jgi:hypothetical protein
MQDEVYNRALFRRRAESAREKLREMGGVGPQGPRGIMASSPELMAAAMPRAMTPQTTGPMPNMMAPQMRPAAAPMQAAALPNIVPGMFPQQPQQQQQAPQAPYQTRQPAPQPQPQPAPMQPGQPKPQPQPIRLNQGGDIALEARRQGLPEPSLGAQIAANPAFAGIRAVDITETPTPRGRSTEGDVLAEVRAILGDNPEAQSRVDQLETTLSNPEATAEERQRAITTAAGVENDKEGLRSVVTDLTGEEPPANATVDELNRAIMGVSIGGAIGGPGSVAERISNAILQGLQVKRETAVGRERFGQELAVARAKAKPDEVKGFLETPRGEAAVEMFSDFMSPGNMTPEQAYARMDQIAPGLGSELQTAMTGGAAAPAPASTPTRSPEETEQLLTMAREAIDQGRDRGAVEQMLTDMGVDPAGL